MRWILSGAERDVRYDASESLISLIAALHQAETDNGWYIKVPPLTRFLCFEYVASCAPREQV